MIVASEIPQTIRFYDENTFYPNDVTCSWLIRTWSDQRVSVNLTVFTDSLAKGDSIEFRDGVDNSLIKTFIGGQGFRHFTHEIESIGNILWMRFRSDEEITGAGFKVTYSSVNKTKGMKPSTISYKNVL